MSTAMSTAAARAPQPLTHPVQLIRIVLQIGLGVMFIVAAYPKIADPPKFASMVQNYKLTPATLINLVAIYLPWLEMVLGASLITGIAWRGANAVSGVLLVFFIVLLSINLARDHAVNCGCFAVDAEPKPHGELLADMRMTILRDVGLLVVVGYLAVAAKLRPRGAAAAPSSSGAA